MKRALLVLLVLIAVVGCGPAPTPNPTATPTPTPMPPAPTDTPLPTAPPPVPTSVASPTPAPTPQPGAVVAVDLLNLRAGPGTNYDILTMMEEGTSLKVVGRTEANDWLKVVTTDGQEGWVFTEMVTVSGDLGAIAVAQAPATPTPLPSPTPEAPTATAEPPTPTPKPGILLEDDFSDPASGWSERDNGDKWWYENGEFHGLVKGAYYLAWQGYPGKVFSDFTLEADARKVEGPNGAGYGLAFRIAGWNNVYIFNITGDGNYTLFKIVDGRRSDLIGWTSAADIIHRGNSTNHLLVVCQGSHIWGYINGQLVADVVDDSHTEGEIGFSIESQEASDLYAAFDNIVVKPAD
jgi:uncharacterized protein YraI